MKLRFWARIQQYGKRNRNLTVAKTVVAAAAITIGLYVSPASAQSTLLAGYDFQTTTNGGTAAVAEVNNGASSPLIYYSGFGLQTGSTGGAAIYLDGSNGSSPFTSTGTAPQVTAFSGSNQNAGPGFSTTTTSPASLGLANSSSNGDRVVFTLSTTGYQNLILTFATQATSTGFKANQFSYSTDGVNFPNFGTTVAPASSFTAAGSTVTEDFSSITALNNAATIYIGYTLAGSTSTSGNNRLDNIQFDASAIGAVPEPATVFAGLLLVGALGWNQRCRLGGLGGLLRVAHAA